MDLKENITIALNALWYCHRSNSPWTKSPSVPKSLSKLYLDYICPLYQTLDLISERCLFQRHSGSGWENRKIFPSLIITEQNKTVNKKHCGEERGIETAKTNISSSEVLCNTKEGAKHNIAHLFGCSSCQAYSLTEIDKNKVNFHHSRLETSYRQS